MRHPKRARSAAARGAQKGDSDEQDDVLEVEPRARRREAFQSGREGGVLQPAVGGVLPAHALERQERHSRRDARRLARLAAALERSVEDPESAAGEGFRQLLGPLPPVAPRR